MDTKIKALRRNYAKLGDLERLRLALAASERGDQEEFWYIQETAPKALYRMVAAPYRGMMEGIFLVTWATLTDIALYSLKMLLFFWLDTLRGDRGLEVECDHGPDQQVLLVKTAKLTIAAWEGLGLFCEELGITRDQALAQAPGFPMLESVLNLAEMVLDAEVEFSRRRSGAICDGGRCEQADDTWAEIEERTRLERADAARRAADLLLAVWRRAAELAPDEELRTLLAQLDSGNGWSEGVRHQHATR